MPEVNGDSARASGTWEGWLQVFPPLVREGLEGVYQSLGPDEQNLVGLLLREMSRHMAASDLKHVLELVRAQFPELEDGAATISIVGPVNSGKSSLFNALVGEDQVKAEVSPVPGTTKSPQFAKSGILTVVDTPGADDVEIGGKGEREGRRRREAALRVARQADFLVIVFDASVGIGSGALAVYRDLRALGRPYLVVLNKIDLVRNHQQSVVALAARNLQLEPGEIIVTSALKGTGLDELIFAIIRADPRLLLTIAEVMPHYRFHLAHRRATQAAAAAGTVNLATSPIPIPFASFLPLMGIQVGLVLSIARIYGYEITRARAKELMTTFAAGLGARTLFQQLVTKIPGAGWALGTAIAASTTLLIGYSATAWFASGEKVAAQTMRDSVEATTQEILIALKEIDRASLSREGLAAILDRATRGTFHRLLEEPKATKP